MDFLIHHMLRHSVHRYPDKEALVHRDERLTYTQVWERTSGLAYGLRRGGGARGDCGGPGSREATGSASSWKPRSHRPCRFLPSLERVESSFPSTDSCSPNK